METIEKLIEIDLPVHQVYQQWTHFEEFPKFMEGITEVKQLDAKHLHWVAEFEGKTKEWEAEIFEQVPDQKIAWRSTSGAPNAGVVSLQPHGERKTVVALKLSYSPEIGPNRAGEVPNQVSRRVEIDLQRFKDFIKLREEETRR